MSQANTIDQVLVRLEAIISDSIKTGNRAGYFAALYHKVTASVKEGIVNGRFEDGSRMERLDVIFANRYLDAYTAWDSRATDHRCLAGGIQNNKETISAGAAAFVARHECSYQS
jgi:hypothetical protein